MFRNILNMNRSQNHKWMFSRLFHSHKMHLVPLLGLLKDRNDTFPYHFIYFNKWNPYLSYGPKAWKSNPLSWRSLPVQVIIGSTPRDLKPFQFYMTLICFISVCHLYPVYLTGSSGNLDEMISNKRNNVCGLMCFSSGRRLVVWLVFGGFHWQKGYKRVPYPCKNRQSYDCFKIFANFLAN